MSYTELVHSFVARLKESPQMVADLWNTLAPLVDSMSRPLAAEDTEDIIAEGIEVLSRRLMRARLVDMGWGAEDMEDVLKGVAIDDSYRVSAFLDITDPAAPRIVMPCDIPAFADKCGNEEYIWDGVLTWRSIEELAVTLAAAKMIAVTKDFEMLTFPVPEPAGGRRKSHGRTARRRKQAKKGIAVSRKRPNRATRKALKARK